jgi:hypothetical protein
MMICGIKTSGTILAAVFGSATSEEMSRPSATPLIAVMNMIPRSIQNMPRIWSRELPIRTNRMH